MPEITTAQQLREALDVYAVPGERSIIDWINPVDGLSFVCHETEEEIRRRYPNAQRMSWETWQAEVSKQQRTPITWHHTTQHEYQRMLEVLPPALWIGGAFLVGEPDDHDVQTGQPRFAAYWRRGSCPEYAQYYRASRALTGRELREQIGQPPSDQIDYLR